MGKKYERAARYALYPNELGLCGPRGSEKGKLYQYLTTKSKVDDNHARRLLGQFAAAAAYLKLIARANGIEDWLDDRVVDAYWIGNELLGRVRPEDLKELIFGFVGEGRMTEAAAKETAGRVHYQHRPHHSFHVLAIGGISGQVERESVGWELCRIGWGEVKAVNGPKVTVVMRSLISQGGKYEPRLDWEEKPREIIRDPAIVPDVRPRELVTFHWGRAVEVITLDEARRLEHYTEATLAACRKMAENGKHD